MGTFVNLFVEKGATVPVDRREEFTKRIEKIYQAGGMMQMESIQLCGKKVATIHKAKMNEQGMNFCYNYFEEAYWENAGFSKKDYSVWSNKIGVRQFHRAVVAAYTLEEFYTEGVAAVIVNGDTVPSWGYIGWINYLFGEKYHIKNFDPWKLYETIHDMGEECWLVEEHIKYDFGNVGYAMIGRCEINAVLYGTEKALELKQWVDKENSATLALEAMKDGAEAVKQYADHSKMDKEKQVRALMDLVHSYYDTDSSGEDVLGICDEEYKPILRALWISDAPAFIVKVIAEIYSRDFWDLWAEVKNVARRKLSKLYGNEYYYVGPVSTKEFFGQSPDDMIPYWEQGCDLKFSKELLDWFDILKNRFDLVLKEDMVINKPMEYIINLMEEAEDNYYHIYTFSDFFEETLENLSDKRYQSLWKLYDEMLHDPSLKEAGDVIFVPDGPEYEHMGLYYWGEQPKRRLTTSWEFMDLDKRNNKARVTFRRYMALVANRELRNKVFGF